MLRSRRYQPASRFAAARETRTGVDAPATSQTKRERRDLLYPLASCVALVCCVLIARPYANSGFIDDWSYSHVALDFARTARVHYNGWGSPTLLFQTLWASAWIRIFGFSFDLLRNITLPFSCGFVMLVYALGRSAGLRHTLALFASLLMATCPLFVPMAASFMTDPYGCFFSAACIYAAVKASISSRARIQISWLWALAILGILGGSDRQTVWIAPFSLIPYLAWKCRSRLFRVHAFLAASVCLGCLVTISYHFRPPYAGFDLHARQFSVLLRREFTMVFGRMLGLFLTCAMLSSPALVLLAPQWRKIERGRLLTLALGSLVGAFVLAAAFGRAAIAPFVGDVLSPYGVLLQGEDMLGVRAAVLPVWLRLALTALVLLATALTVLVWRRLTPAQHSPALAIFGVFTVCSVPPLIPGALLNLTYDRYVLPILPLVVIAVLLRFQTMQVRTPFAGWALVAAFACYSIATTHDYYARLTARSSLAQILVKAGIPSDRISAGFEPDGWARLQRTGHIASVRYGGEAPGNASDTFWFWYFARIDPTHVVCYSEHDPHATLERSFRPWLSPTKKGYVFVRHRAAAGYRD